jgi:hypothetical protein
MDGTVESMTRAVAVLAITGAAACTSSYSLEVSVQHPPGSEVTRTVVSVYESSSARCAHIELGDLTAAELDAILVTEQEVGSGAGLSGIARVERKLVVARGYDAQARLRTAGCSEQGEIEGRAEVLVTTRLAATLSLGVAPLGARGIAVTLTDAEGRALAQHPIAWRVFGPDGSTPAASGTALSPLAPGAWELAAPTCSDAGGSALLNPVPPARVAGYAAELRPSWSARPNLRLTSFTRVDPTPTQLTPLARASRPCAVRIAGATRRLVCLVQSPGAAAREYEVTVAAGDARLVERAAVAVDPRTVALFAVPRGADRDVYAIAEDARVTAIFPGPSTPLPGPAPAALGTVTDALLLPACGAGESARVLVAVAVSVTQVRLFTLPVLGGALTDYHGVSADVQVGLRAAGCVTELRANADPRRRQASVVDVERRVQSTPVAASSIVLECSRPDPADCRVPLPVSRVGAALSPPGDPDEARLTSMLVDATGPVMAAWVLAPAPSGDLRLIERERVPAASIPSAVVTGQFDADGRIDLIWDLQNVAQATTAVQITYARRVADARLSALARPLELLTDHLIAGELTGDGFDDLVVVGRRRDTSGGIPTVEPVLTVVPLNAPIPNPNPAVDPPCQ